MSAQSTEIHIREQTKIVLRHLQNSELEEARNIILNNKELLRYNFGLINFISLIPRIRFSKLIPRNFQALKMVIDAGFEIFTKEDNVNELLFFAAAKCETEALKQCVGKVLEKAREAINQVREGDTVLMFLVKYGNLRDERYPECVNILIDAGIDVDRNDYSGRNCLELLMNSYATFLKKQYQDHVVLRNLKQSIEFLLKAKSMDLNLENLELQKEEILKEFNFAEAQHAPTEDEEKVQLFKYLLNKDEKSLMKSKQVLKFLDADDGNDTLLQLCCEKNFKLAAKFLIEKGADVGKTTERNPQTPLELAARRNHSEIFQNILASNKVEIDEHLFLTFLRGRPKHIKAKYFDEVLKYKNLDVNIRSSNGNTPLHYAIIFSSTEAISVLLQRGASLTVENDSKKCPLDYISAEDFERYLNKCIVPDTYNDIHNGKYEIALNYRNLIESKDLDIFSELSIIERIANSSKLCHLLNHPLISSFIDIKWKLVEPVYQSFLVFNFLFYAISILSFVNLNLLHYLAVPLTLLYSFRIWLIFNKRNTLHEFVDIVIALAIFATLFTTNNTMKHDLGMIATIFMAFSCHLFWRYSPQFSQLHASLMILWSQFVSYLLYVVILIIFFGAALYIFVLPREETYSNNFWNTWYMSVNPKFYLLCIFGIFVSIMILMTLIKSVAYVQNNADHIKSNFQVLGVKDTITFLKSIEDFYMTYQIVRNPFIFDKSFMKDKNKVDANLEESNKKKQKKANRPKNNFLLNFYVNINKFSFEKLLSLQLSDANVAQLKKSVTS